MLQESIFLIVAAAGSPNWNRLCVRKNSRVVLSHPVAEAVCKCCYFLKILLAPDFSVKCDWLTHSTSDLSLPQGKAGSGWDVFPVGMWDDFLSHSKDWHSPESQSHRKEQGFLISLHISGACIQPLLYLHLYGISSNFHIEAISLVFNQLTRPLIGCELLIGCCSLLDWSDTSQHSRVDRQIAD